MTGLLLIRHGETDWNLEGRYQGQADPDLNPKGILQSKQFAELSQCELISRIVSSPLMRARQTAEIFALACNVPLEFDPRLMEIHQGEWQTRLRSEISTQYPELFQKWETNPWSVSAPGGESLQTVRSRVLDAVSEIVYESTEGIIAIVTHRIPIAIIKIELQSLDPDIVRTIHLPNLFSEMIDTSKLEWEGTSAVSQK